MENVIILNRFILLAKNNLNSQIINFLKKNFLACLNLLKAPNKVWYVLKIQDQISSAFSYLKLGQQLLLSLQVGLMEL
jgi:hypothetical protein